MSKSSRKQRSRRIAEAWRPTPAPLNVEWEAWQAAHSLLIWEAGLPRSITATRDAFFQAMNLGWRHRALARLWPRQREALRRLLWSVETDPESVWPDLYPERPARDVATEAAWDKALGERDLDHEALRRATPRQLRLFATTCCRRAPGWQELHSAEALEVIEQYADGEADSADLLWARKAAETAATWAKSNYNQAAVQAAELLKLAAQVHLRTDFKRFLDLDETQRASWRELLGNPFRQLRTQALAAPHDVTRLATAIYAERAFDGMPMLGDALEETGCRDERVLTHCRDPIAQHTRGCWVLDWLRRGHNER